MHCCKHWRHYLHGKNVVVHSDHCTLQYPFKQPQLSPRQTRWQAALADFDLEIKYIQGTANVVADALSHPSSIDKLTTTVVNRIPKNLRCITSPPSDDNS